MATFKPVSGHSQGHALRLAFAKNKFLQKRGTTRTCSEQQHINDAPRGSTITGMIFFDNKTRSSLGIKCFNERYVVPCCLSSVSGAISEAPAER